MRIIETDNFGGDYPNESFLNLAFGTAEEMQRIADAVNAVFCRFEDSPRFWRVVENDYKLQPGFEP